MDECRAAKTPLIELLRSVPKHAVEMYEHNPTHRQNIPYGRLCHEAADALEAWNRRAEDVSIKEYQQDLQLRDDHIAEQAARIKELEERRCEICGYAEHHREHTGCLRVFVDEQAAEISRLRKVLAKCKKALNRLLFHGNPEWAATAGEEALAAIKEEGL